MSRDKKKDDKYSIDQENLAIPEVHTGKVEIKDTEETEEKTSVSYETLAMPEIHIKKHK